MRNFIKIIEEIVDDEETPEERARDEESTRVRNLEKKIQSFCEKTLNWSFDQHSYSVAYDPDSNEITLIPDNEEVTLAELSKLTVLGDSITVSPGSKQFTLIVTIRAHTGLNISTG